MARVAPVAAMQRTAASSPPRVEVYSYDARSGTDTLVQQTGGLASTDAIARQAFENVTRVERYYLDEFHRNGYDGKGTVTKVRVHAPDTDGSTPMPNARWYNDEGRLWLGDGDAGNTTLLPLGGALDVIAHEFTHGVVDAEVTLDYQGQEGALNESWADVMGSGIDRNWQIGETVFTPGIAGDAIRDLSAPTYGDLRTLPSWVTEVHDMSGIPSLAAVKVADRVGQTEMRRIWYAALCDHLHAHAGFAAARKATMEAAAQLDGKDSAAYQAVRDAWDAVGVLDTSPKVRAQRAIDQFDPRSMQLVGATPHPASVGTARRA